MGKEGNNRFKKEHNNYNPYNKLELNRFHQAKPNQRLHEGHQLHKKKRDIERMIQHLKKKGLEVEQDKVEELEAV